MRNRQRPFLIRPFLLAVILVACCSAAAAQGQPNFKIGYANMELVLAYMPESKNVEQELSKFHKTFSDQLQTKQNYAQAKYSEYLELKESGQTEAQLAPLEQELRRLDEEIKKFTAESEQKILRKRQELMDPILEKLGKTIKEVAAAEGFTMVLNTVDSGGVSSVLHAPDEWNLTKKILARLGVKVPDEL